MIQSRQSNVVPVNAARRMTENRKLCRIVTAPNTITRKIRKTPGNSRCTVSPKMLMYSANLLKAVAISTSVSTASKVFSTRGTVLWRFVFSRPRCVPVKTSKLITAMTHNSKKPRRANSAYDSQPGGTTPLKAENK